MSLIAGVIIADRATGLLSCTALKIHTGTSLKIHAGTALKIHTGSLGHWVLSVTTTTRAELTDASNKYNYVVNK